MNPPARLLLAAALSVAPSTLAAQAPAPLLFELPASTEALGLGNVFPVSGRDSDAVHYNPAALARARGVGVAVQPVGSGTTLVTGSGALAWLGGGVGVGVQALSYDATADGAPDESDLVTDGALAVSEMAATIGYGREVGPVELGAAARLVSFRAGGASATSGSVDVGATAEVGFLTLGLAAQHLGPALELAGGPDEGGYRVSMPDRFTLSGAFEPEPLGPLDVRAVAAVSRRTDGEIIPAGGVDVRYWPVRGRTFIGRVGVRRVPDGPALPVTFGLAFWGDALALEYAFQAYEGSSDAHRIGLRWRQ